MYYINLLLIQIISAQQLPQPKGASAKASSIDPYIVVQVYGMAIDCAEARTRTVSNEGKIIEAVIFLKCFAQKFMICDKVV